jgi:hypothetical protein
MTKIACAQHQHIFRRKNGVAVRMHYEYLVRRNEKECELEIVVVWESLLKLKMALEVVFAN